MNTLKLNKITYVDNSSNKIFVPNEGNKWNKYIEKTYSLLNKYGFIVIEKNNVERKYKDINNRYEIIISFRFLGRYYKERECSLKMFNLGIDISDIKHYSPKKIYKRLKELLKSLKYDYAFDYKSNKINNKNLHTSDIYITDCYVDIENRLDDEY